MIHIEETRRPLRVAAHGIGAGFSVFAAALACAGALAAPAPAEPDLEAQIPALSAAGGGNGDKAGIGGNGGNGGISGKAEGEREGLKVAGSFLAVGQRVPARGTEDGLPQGRLNYRGDVMLTMPGPSAGAAQGTVAAQLRFGQGGGVALRPTYTATVNSTGFDPRAGSSESYVIVAQAYYQIVWALGAGRLDDRAGQRLELTLGKLDVFGQFDQNAVAGDEGSQFLNNIFVHNPLLDSGGGIAADRYGFAPGVRLAYFVEGDSAAWGASVGVLGAGSGARFGGSPGRPFVISQFEVSPRQVDGTALGTYRLYVWTNGRTRDLDGNEQRHTGFGLSVDHRLGPDLNLFGRVGRRLRGSGTFDNAVTIGFEHGGRAWGRGDDAIGVALGSLVTGSAWRNATADGTRSGYTAAGAERSFEVYYRVRMAENLDVSPDFQLIQRPGGDAMAPTVRVLGLRARLGF